MKYKVIRVRHDYGPDYIDYEVDVATKHAARRVASAMIEPFRGTKDEPGEVVNGNYEHGYWEASGACDIYTINISDPQEVERFECVLNLERHEV